MNAAGKIEALGRFFDDLEVDESIDLGEATFSDADIMAFAHVGGDFYEVHTNDKAARTLGFERRIAHGLLIVARVDAMKMRCSWRLQAVATLSLKWDYKQAVLSGDRIVATMRVKSKRETKRPDRGIVVLAIDVFNQRGECVHTGETTTMMIRNHTA
ncbi:MaoC/PaaZ C-terminal domain-containing protein [Caballeronia sp. GAFFF2]|uniref:MaoC family dehydratase n=1 Tax=Caballeronia sp. GAFFF2 TaxID=2921741 RepID=UPI002028420E|nr:MaoC/PaaZ C-terminal domain-containing protein [Caballeronia sp. GAFFF2]